MPTISDLTPQQFKQLLDEYFAPPEKRSKMTESEIKDLAERLDERINIPIVGASGERKIFIKIVLKVDRFLYDNLPNELYDLARSLDEGIDDKEARRLTRRLAKLANKHIDIPYIPESVEFLAIRIVIGVVINAARKKWNMALSIKKAGDMKVPRSRYATERELSAMIR